jgi:hypothetical protein
MPIFGTLHWPMNNFGFPYWIELRFGTVVYWGLDLGFLLLHNKKPLNHWPFQQQATRKLAVSLEVTDGGT